MPSLKEKANFIARQRVDGARAEALGHKREQAQTTNRTTKRRRLVETFGNRQKKRLFGVDEDDPVLEIVPPSSKKRKTTQKRKSVERGSLERVNMEDKDYLEFLGMLSANGDFYSESGEYNLDFRGKTSVDNSLPRRKNGVDKVGCGLKNSREDNVDPDYKIFLENAREDGDSYVFELKKGKRTVAFVRYEEEEKAKADTLNDENDHPDDDTSSEENQQDFSGKVTPKKEVLDTDFQKTNGRSCQNPSPNVATSQWFLSGCKPGTISCADESYLKFLDRLWVTGHSLTYSYEDVIVKYEDDKGVVTDSEELRPRVASHDKGKGKKFTPNPNLKTSTLDTSEDDSDSVQILDDRSARIDYEEMLRKKLREVLQSPFDRKELEEKQNEANVRKPVEGTKETRARSVSFPTNRQGTSYLDRHPDLNGILCGAKEHPERSLALLRCLFFYYENVSNQGSFVPWKSPPTWLHNIICCCPGNSECPMNTFHGTKRRC